MHDNPRATDEEQEAAQQGGRQQDEDSMRYPGHDDPDAQSDAARREGDGD
jgi:hypothetical protein